MAQTLLTVTPEQIGSLDAAGAVQTIADLLRSEAQRLGVPVTNVHVSMQINVADGGVDASVDIEDIEDAAWDGSFIPDERTALQVKTGDSFKPWQESEIREELFGSKTPSKEALGASVRACLDDNGTYVLVCMGVDPNEQQRRQADAHLKKFFDLCGYAGAEFEVWGQSTIAGLLERFPALALRINGQAGARFQTHSQWSAQAEMRRELKVGEKQQEFMEAARKELRVTDRPVHLHVRGEAGAGKTRLTLEATSTDDLRPLVLYFEGPATLLQGELMSVLLQESSQVSAILVVDECDLENRARIWELLEVLQSSTEVHFHLQRS
jgi:hypothetical protein